MSMPSSSAGHRLPLSSVAATVVKATVLIPRVGQDAILLVIGQCW